VRRGVDRVRTFVGVEEGAVVDLVVEWRRVDLVAIAALLEDIRWRA